LLYKKSAKLGKKTRNSWAIKEWLLKGDQFRLGVA
jgi:hypothetical protein